jgi:5-methyltetrahydropteroyltriglutamate--homocysteine methyltransferase
VVLPGVIAHTTAVVERPETVAERIMCFAPVVGQERVITGADCGLPRAPCTNRQHPTAMWAKFEALVEGARLAFSDL